MPGKAMVGGELYDITTSKVMVEGVKYDVTAGKTMVGGELHDIEFKEPTLKDLFLNATVLAKTGISSTTSRILYVEKSAAPASGTAYWISAIGDHFVIYKIVDRVVNQTPVFAIGPSTLYQETGMMEKNGKLYYHPSTGYRTTGNDTYVYSGSIFLVTFPYPDSTVESIFSSSGRIIMDGDARVNTSTGSDKASFYTSKKTYDLYLVIYNSEFDVWESDGNNWTQIARTGTSSISTVYSDKLYVSEKHSSVVGGTIIGFKYTTPDPKSVTITVDSGITSIASNRLNVTIGGNTYTVQSGNVTGLSVRSGDTIIATYCNSTTSDNNGYFTVDYSCIYLAASYGGQSTNWVVPTGPSEIAIVLQSGGSNVRPFGRVIITTR